MREIATEIELAQVARALAGKQAITSAEKRLLKPNGVADSITVKAVRQLILAGDDPLGECLLALRAPEVRRTVGAVYTPPAIVDAMIAWAAGRGPPRRVVDPGCGSGRFTSAAAAAFPKARLVACDIDPLAILILRANAAVLGFAERLDAHVQEYRLLQLEKTDGPTLYVGNPPYVRHHQINADAKDWFTQTAASFGFRASKLAGLHAHFFLRTRELASVGDWGVFITAAEWMDVNYGSVIRQMLGDGLGGTSLHVFKPDGMPFADAMTTGVITTFAVGNRPAQFLVRELSAPGELTDLDSGRSIAWEQVVQCDRWSALTRPPSQIPANMVQLGELFRVHRGAVTGDNGTFIEGAYPGALPSRFLVPAVTKAKELFAAGDALCRGQAAKLRRIIALPADHSELSSDERKAVEAFKAWARERETHLTYTSKSRKAWWSVQLPEAAPILCTYMARQAPTFVRNLAGARHINIAHGLYPRVPMTHAELDAYAAYLRANVCRSAGRTYAGGLTKFEPKEIERLFVPCFSKLRAKLRPKLDVSKGVVPASPA